MVCKRILNLVLGLLMLVSIANAANFFDSFEYTFEYEKPSTMKILSFQCQDAGCTVATPIAADYYKGDSVVCWTQYGLKGDEAGYLNCMKNYKVAGNTLDLNDPATITNGAAGNVAMFAKYNTNAPFGYITYFYTNGDTYMVNYFRHTSFTCAYSTCVDAASAKINFIRGKNALAEIGQLNIKNTENPLLPIQVEVPVKIEETVCSAYRFSQPTFYRPLPPAGYSDYSANTKVTLDITNNANGVKYSHQEITIPILADTCAGLAAFKWTPSSSLIDTEIKFRAETEVIDKQVVSSRIDWAEAIETIYPETLDDACWARAYDFTLSNIPSTTMTTSVAQITKGESLYALFRAGAYRDESITPMQYSAAIYFNGAKLYDQTFMSKTNVQLHTVNLSNTIANLNAGVYEVKLIITPKGVGCKIVEDVKQIQKLEILPISEYTVKFHVRDETIKNLAGANVNFKLLDADDYFQVDPVYNKNQLTTSTGIATFDDVIAGDYRYVVSYSGYSSVTNDIHIGGPTDIYVTMVKANTAPVIDLPASFTEYYKNPIIFDIRNYIDDYNDNKEDLTITYKVTSGTLNVAFDGRYFTIRDDAPSTNTLEITVKDPAGATAKDSVQIIFIDNKAPVVVNFEAVPDNGPVPFEPTFKVSVTDAENDKLECTLEFGDGTSAKNECINLNNIKHVYANPGTYIAKLTVKDGFNTPVVVEEKVFAYLKINQKPVIETFTANPDTGYAPLNTKFSIVVTDIEGDVLTCTLSFGDGTSSVTDRCSNLNGKTHTYQNTGSYTATLTAKDGTNTVTATEHITVFTKMNEKPVIVKFIANPDTGYAPLHTTFSVIVTDKENDKLTCTLSFGDGTASVTDDCEDLNSKTHTYQKAGSYTATLTAKDGTNTVTATEKITVFEKINQKPVIIDFDANPDEGYAPLYTEFVVKVSDADGDALTCTIDFADGSNTVTDDCDDLNGISHTYKNPGSYKARLTVTDGKDTVTASDIVTVLEKINEKPIIVKFTANPDTGYAPLYTTFSVIVTDAENDVLTCTLNFGDGTMTSDLCYKLNGKKHTYTNPGSYTATLTARDGTNTVTATEKITVLEPVNHAPFILRFEAVPDYGYAPLQTTFRVTVTDVDYDDLTCTIEFGDNTNSVTKDCDDIDKLMHTYQNPGSYTATLSVTDGEEIVKATEHIKVIEPINNEPIVIKFHAVPDNGIAPLKTVFVIEVADPEGDDLLCTLAFGDGTQSVTDDCDDINLHIHTYTDVGTYKATLSVTDGKNTIKAYEYITVISGVVPMPRIDSFTLESSNEEFVPTDLTLEWTTSHNLGYPTECSLSINGATAENVPCNGGKDIADYNIVGVATFTLTIIDNESNTASETIRTTFYREEDKDLGNLELELLIDKVIAPGDFKFAIKSGNESLSKRFVRIEPQIICRGTVNELSVVGDLLRSSAVTSSDKEGFIHEFRTNTLDFELTIPKDELCIFRTVLTDKYDSEVILEKEVTFSYMTREATFASIRGEGTDVMNYMSSTLLGGINKGYNLVSFNVLNNEAKRKELSITMISAQLGVEFGTNIELAPGQYSEVTIPLFIKDSAKPGLYPVRYTVRDDSETQTRYSYILIK